MTSFAGRRQLAHGPFEPAELPSLGRSHWALLAQGVNLHDDRTNKLMSKCRFIPDARLDDLMISLASNQGGVGPHLDSYDVFLIQLWGKRRWRTAPRGNDRLKPGLLCSKSLSSSSPLRRELSRTHDAFVTVEEHVVIVGAGSAVAEALAAEGISIDLVRLGLPDRFIDHGEQGKPLQPEGLDAVGIERTIRQRFVMLRPGAEPRLVASRSA